MNFAEQTDQQLDDPSRRAALMVHALAESDQAWMVAQLLPAEQGRLKALISELAELRIPPDRRLLTEALQSHELNDRDVSFQRSNGPSNNAKTDVDYFVNFDPAAEGELANALRHEPALLIVQLFRIQKWTWQQRVFERLTTLQRQQVEDMLANSSMVPSGTAMSEAILRHLRVRCESSTGSRQVPPLTTGSQQSDSMTKGAFHRLALHLRWSHK